MRVIDLRSDTITTPTSAMREFMMHAEVGDDVFGEDPTVNDLQNMIAEMLGKEAALFVTSGTQANQVSINTHTQPGNEVICDYNSHIFNYESGSAGMLSGVQLHPIHGDNGHPTAKQISEVIREKDDHLPQSRLVCLENTHNRAGGTIFPIEEIERIYSLAKEKDLKMHLDGARLWNAALETGNDLKKYASYFDSVSLCFSKGLGAPVGSIIVGSEKFIERAHFYRKAYGGGMRQVGILAAACIFAVENHFERLIDDHTNAKLLAKGLADLELFEVNMKSVQTNIVIVDITSKNINAFEITNLMKENGILAIPFSACKIRFVTHMNVSQTDIEYCIDKLGRLFKNR
jgi:threonine aldolase